MSQIIRIRGARQNNLKNIDLDLETHQFVVITGVSGSGKSSLAFDTLFAEGQRRYVETFSPYARQFLDRMDKPAADRIEGIPPSIAIDQSNPIRNSRSSVGTLTELNDHLKLLFARASSLYCGHCGSAVQRDHPQDFAEKCLSEHASARASIHFEIDIPDNFEAAEIEHWLDAQGYIRRERLDNRKVRVTQDRLRLTPQRRDRLVEALEVALHHGNGQAQVDVDGTSLKLSTDLRCRCGHVYGPATPSLFSFNSAMGACDHCKGFGRIIGVDYGLVIADSSKSIREGAVKPFQTETNAQCQRDLLHHATQNDFPLDTPWEALTAAQKAWVIDGEGGWRSKKWYGVKRFFEWLESRAYKMHVRVLLSRYRSYERCNTCAGSRLQSTSLLWRIGSNELANNCLEAAKRFMPSGIDIDRSTLESLPGLHLHDLMGLPISSLHRFIDGIELPASLAEGTAHLRDEIRRRLAYLNAVGVAYLSLDRQSRTLSGGEIQRINLTTALGTSLCNTLFVLDEPSIGLHPHDIDRIIKVMHDLRDQGNTLVVVEHDPQIMLAADRIIDMGPHAGKRGGEILFNGLPAALLAQKQSITASFMRRERSVGSGLSARKLSKSTAWLKVIGACQHNLKNVDLALPLGHFICVTGVSGSGKSTLVHDTAYMAIRQAFGEPLDKPGSFKSIQGLEHIGRIELVDQSAIGRSTRSTPATYTGAFEAIRKAFVKLPEAKERNYKPGTFSFSSGLRCPNCSGNGFEHIEMQFLADVYLRCSQCDGKRYTAELLEICMTGADNSVANIAQVLEQSVDEAVVFFAEHNPVLKALQPLIDVGLGYISLGQAVPTLSAGEAQRLKLAGHLAKMRELNCPTLFLFDEPTTGLHFADIQQLMQAFEPLLEAGHTIVVVEHNLDVIQAADWVIELGPEGGDKGGEIIFNGAVPALLKSDCPTGVCLRHHQQSDLSSAAPSTMVAEAAASYPRAPSIEIIGARENNLQNISVNIPRDGVTVITGLSGSGKSTLAFDLVFAEGQRRYLESLNAYARQFVQPAVKPEVDALRGLPPTVAIEQRTSRGGRKSTVATATELYHFLRILYVSLGTQHCPKCEIPIEVQSQASIAADIQKRYRNKTVKLLAPMIRARKGLYKELAAWADKKGFEQLRVDGEPILSAQFPALDRYSEHNIELVISTLKITPNSAQSLDQALELAITHGNGYLIVEDDNAKDTLYSTRRSCPNCHGSFEPLDPRLFSFNSKMGWCTDCFGTGEQVELQSSRREAGDPNDEKALKRQGDEACKACQGSRLNNVASAVRWQGHSIVALSSRSVNETYSLFKQLKLSQREAAIGRDIVEEILGRLAFLQQVGLGYLALNRAAPSLSGGEAQRIRLAAQLGSNLQGVAYILDEPSIGLHPADNDLLIQALRNLANQGNTVIVVEHDEATIRHADHLIDIGPGAGHRGGKIVAQGNLATLLNSDESPTAAALKNPIEHPLRKHARPSSDAYLQLRGAYANNLQHVDVDLPLRQLLGVAGVSGSGKSTLIRRVLKLNIEQGLKNQSDQSAIDCQSLKGILHVERLLEVDQSPIGKTPRSTPATYIGIWDAVRTAFSNTSEAQIRGYTPARFSFNSGPGRCPFCEGKGMQTMEMSFLPDVKVLCESCNGLRFNRETLSVQFKHKSIGEVLAMEVDEAVEFFDAHPKIHYALRLLQRIGLGYLSLGQPSPTLSGGEAQRIKLVAELSKARTQARKKPTHTLYLLDEPTVGLHMADVSRLIDVLHDLVDAGHSCVVIEHNLDVLAECDQVIEMGPCGGDQGGQLVAQVDPRKIKTTNTPTTRFLKPLFQANNKG